MAAPTVRSRSVRGWRDAASRWATPTNNASDGLPAASFVYTETFSLTGLDAATATFSGRYAADDNISSITLNGTTLANTGGGYTFWTSFSSAGATFLAGVNTLTFDTQNSGGGPTGLRVEVSGTANTVGTVPEASAWAMMLAGFALVGFSVRRRSSAVAA